MVRPHCIVIAAINGSVLEVIAIRKSQDEEIIIALNNEGRIRELTYGKNGGRSIITSLDMDFETDKELEEEMTNVMDNMIMPMLEGTGEVPMTGLMFPDSEHLPEEIKEDMKDNPDAKAMFVIPAMGAPNKDAFYQILSGLARDNKVRTRCSFLIHGYLKTL